MILIINYSLLLGNRISMRKNLIQTILHENPNIGKGNNSFRYHYNVERFYDYDIFLKRPTQLNNPYVGLHRTKWSSATPIALHMGISDNNVRYMRVLFNFSKFKASFFEA